MQEYKILNYIKESNFVVGTTKAIAVAKQLIEKIQNFIGPLTNYKSSWIDSFKDFLGSAASVLKKLMILLEYM